MEDGGVVRHEGAVVILVRDEVVVLMVWCTMSGVLMVS